ncbi:phosphoribosylanthranilate isomerase [Ruicaihuangia caeni]|uniref:phosphoribosylanthranilate isomerase n=1 Tax=Ruicaihuangia caeni TaxID=3042517 RepID=UPI00338DA3B8
MVFVKICGLRSEEHVDAAIEGGADAVGFVLTDSPRYIDVDSARSLVEHVAQRALTFAVVRDVSVEEAHRLANETGAEVVQVHGEFTPQQIEWLVAQGRPVVRAVPFSRADEGSLGEQYLLIDAPRAGSGEPWDYASMRDAALPKQWLLAGGLTPDTVADAIRASGAWGVDVSSGVEVAPGEKSSTLIRAFLDAAKSAHVAR